MVKRYMIMLFLGATAARAELAIKADTTYLYYIEGDRTFSAKCDDYLIHNRDHCRKDLYDVPSDSFVATLRPLFGVQLPRLDEEARTTWVALNAVDTRLFQLVNTEAATVPNPVTSEDVVATERSLQKIEQTVVAVNDQIARLEAETDADSMAELTIQRENLAKVLHEKSKAQAKLLDLRRLFVDQRALTGDHAFDDLVSMRGEYQAAFDAAQTKILKELDDKVCAEIAVRRIAEMNFTWTDVCQGSANARIEQAFLATPNPSFIVPFREGAYATSDDGVMYKKVQVREVVVDERKKLHSFELRFVGLDGRENLWTYHCHKMECETSDAAGGAIQVVGGESFEYLDKRVSPPSAQKFQRRP